MIKYKTSEGDTFEYPTSLEDITLNQYLEFLDIVEPTKPEELVNIEAANIDFHSAETEKEKASAKLKLGEMIDALTDIVMYKKVYPYYARVVAYFASGITEQQIIGGKKHGDGMNLGHLTMLYSNLIAMLNNPEEPEYSPIIQVAGELWYLPRRYMEKSKLIEYAEASQFEDNLQKVTNGHWKALPKIMCVLVRKENELYSDKLMSREAMFLSWSLADCLKVAFFLLKRSELSLLSLETFTAAQDLSNLKLESKN